ncbi:MAG: DUF4386 domain-containing protein [Chloroflexi bacterium]|nr:DUF4386 domain-containing protein [Chloroflexota bacterium]
MKESLRKSRVLGIAFLIQSVVPIVANMAFLSPLINADDIHQTMVNVAGHAIQLQIGVFGELITALGIIFLGVVLYQALRKENAIMAMTGLCFYILEAVLVVVSRSNDIFLLELSQSYMATVQPESIAPLAGMLMTSRAFNYSAAMLAFSVGAPLFYYLLFRTRLVPRWMSMWGLVTAICPCLVSTVGSFFGYHFPIWFYLPYIPFEFVTGLWIVVFGIPVPEANK